MTHPCIVSVYSVAVQPCPTAPATSAMRGNPDLLPWELQIVMEYCSEVSSAFSTGWQARWQGCVEELALTVHVCLVLLAQRNSRSRKHS